MGASEQVEPSTLIQPGEVVAKRRRITLETDGAGPELAVDPADSLASPATQLPQEAQRIAPASAELAMSPPAVAKSARQLKTFFGRYEPTTPRRLHR